MMRLFNTNWYLAVVGILFGLVVVYSTYQLTESPPTWFDEGIYIQVAQSLSDRGVEVIQTAPGTFESAAHVTVGYSVLAPIALSLKIFGHSLLAARIAMAVFILLCVLVAFIYIYKVHGKKDALFALLLLSTFPLLYGNGKNVLGEVPGMLYVIIGLCSLWQLEKSEFRSVKWYVLTGLFVGLAVVAKPVFFLLPLAVGLVLLVRIRSTPVHIRPFVLGIVVFVLPVGIWAYMQFGNTFDVSVLSHYSNPYAENSLLYAAIQNLLRFFKEVTPLYCAGLVGVWVLACGVRLYKREQVSFSEMVALTFSLLVLLSYLRTEGWYRYFFEAMVLALIFLPSSLRSLLGARHGLWCKAPLILLALFQFYQLNFSSWVAEHYQSTQTHMLEDFFATYTLQSVFVYNSPELVPFLHTTNYYQYFDINPAGTLAYGSSTLSLLKQGVPAEVLTSAFQYKQHMTLFEGYRQSTSVAGYLVLTKK